MTRRLPIVLTIIVLGVIILSGCNKTEIQNPTATIEMENGEKIVIELYYDKVPNTVLNFINLADNGYYDGLIFHRVIDGFMIQGGCPEGTGMGGPGYNIKGEFANNGFVQNDISHTPGVISMARRGSQFDPASAYNTAGSQFFICDEPANGYDTKMLDKDYAAFGKVTSGMEVVERISSVDTDRNNKPLENQIIKTISIDTKEQKFGEPEIIK